METLQENITGGYSTQMNLKDYEKIRNKRSFLYEFFVAKTGSKVKKARFQISFGVWVRQFGIPEYEAMVHVVKFLDSKYGRK